MERRKGAKRGGEESAPKSRQKKNGERPPPPGSTGASSPGLLHSTTSEESAGKRIRVEFRKLRGRLEQLGLAQKSEGVVLRARSERREGAERDQDGTKVELESAGESREVFRPA